MDDRYSEIHDEFEREMSDLRAQMLVREFQRRRRMKNAVLQAATMLLLVATLITAFLVAQFPELRGAMYAEPALPVTGMATKPEVQQLAMRIERAEAALAKKPLSGSSTSPETHDQQMLRYKGLDERLRLIEKSISSDPERALSIPLQRRDIDMLSMRLAEFQTRSDTDVRQLSSTVYAIFWALLSAMGMLILAAIGLLARAFFRRDGKDVVAEE